MNAGINVVTTSTTRLVNPRAYEPAEWRDQLTVAAKEGQAALYASGLNLRFRDPNVTWPQTIAGAALHLTIVALAPQAAFPQLANLVTVFACSFLFHQRKPRFTRAFVCMAMCMAAMSVGRRPC